MIDVWKQNPTPIRTMQSSASQFPYCRVMGFLGDPTRGPRCLEPNPAYRRPSTASGGCLMPIWLKYKWHYPNCVAEPRAAVPGRAMARSRYWPTPHSDSANGRDNRRQVQRRAKEAPAHCRQYGADLHQSSNNATTTRRRWESPLSSTVSQTRFSSFPDGRQEIPLPRQAPPRSQAHIAPPRTDGRCRNAPN